MQTIKKCPFCMNNCTTYLNKETGTYIIECENCKKNGLILKIEAKDKTTALNLWNNRKLEDFILKYPEESIAFIHLLNGDRIDPEKLKEVLKEYSYHKLQLDVSNILGYIIDLDGMVYPCDKSHMETLLSCLGMENIADYNQTTFEAIIQNVFTKQGYIKISTQAKCMMLEINTEKINKKQIDGLIKFICEDPQRFQDIKVYYLDLFDSVENCKIEVFYDLNDLILFLNKLA